MRQQHLLGVGAEGDRVRAVRLRALLDRPVLGLGDRAREGDHRPFEVDVAPSQRHERAAAGTHGRSELDEGSELRSGDLLHGANVGHRRDVELAGLHPGRVCRPRRIGVHHALSHRPVEHRPDLAVATGDHRRRETGLIFETPVETIEVQAAHLLGVPGADDRKDVVAEVVRHCLGGLRRPTDPVPASRILAWPVRVLPRCAISATDGPRPGYPAVRDNAPTRRPRSARRGAHRRAWLPLGCSAARTVS